MSIRWAGGDSGQLHMFPYASTSHRGIIFGVISGLRWGGYITWSQAQLKEGPPGAAFTGNGGSAASMGAVTSSLVRLATAHHGSHTVEKCANSGKDFPPVPSLEGQAECGRGSRVTERSESRRLFVGGRSILQRRAQ